LGAQVLHLLRHPAEGAAMGAAGRAWHRANQGAGARTLAGVAEILDARRLPAGRIRGGEAWDSGGCN